MDQKLVKKEIMDATIAIYKRQGMKFTMDDLAKEMHRSKKTIYAVFPDKNALLDTMVDYVFDSIKESEKSAGNEEESTVERLRHVLGAMPEQYQSLDFQELYVLQDKYPEIYDHVQRRLENGWEQTIALLKEGMEEGVLREISIPVFKTMFQATLEQFFQQGVLVENGISYNDALQEVVNIMMDGICLRT